MRALSIILMALALHACAASQPDMPGTPWSGVVVQVHDGDTITVIDRARGRMKIRIYGIDAPELAQPYGSQAQGLTYRMLLRQEVRGWTVAMDRYGRDVAVVTVGGTDVSEALVQAGLAWVYPGYCRIPTCADWKSYQEQAKARRLGLWQAEKPIPPWEWRRRRPAP